VIGLDKNNELHSPQLLPGREKPPRPWDDRKKTGMSVAEMIKEKMEDIIDEN
jgi:hypothetical protein